MSLRKSYVWKEGRLIERGFSPSVEVHGVTQDSFKTPLRHPKTGEMVESLTRWNAINKEHKLKVVGNDWIKDGPKNDLPDFDKRFEEKLTDAMEKAWSIESNYDLRMEKRGREREELEKFHRFERHIIEIPRIKDL